VKIVPKILTVITVKLMKRKAQKKEAAKQRIPRIRNRKKVEGRGREEEGKVTTLKRQGRKNHLKKWITSIPWILEVREQGNGWNHHRFSHRIHSARASVSHDHIVLLSMFMLMTLSHDYLVPGTWY